MSHPIQRCRFDEEFGRLLREFPCTQGRPKEGLEAKESGFCQAPAMVPRLLLPSSPALLPDRPQVLISLPGWGGTVAMLPNLGVPARGDHGLRPPLLDGVVAAPLVIGPIGTDLANLPLHVLQQVRQGLFIGDPRFTRYGRDDLPRGFVHCQVQFAPRAPLTP